MSDYMIDDNSWKGKKTLDIRAFARDLAPFIGGELMPEGENDSGRVAYIMRGSNKISILTIWNKPGFVTINISAPDINWEIARDMYGAQYKTESANFSVSRDMNILAKSIQNRVINPNIQILANQREFAKNRLDSVNKMENAIEQASKRNPDFTFNKRDSHNASIGVTGVYVCATMDSNLNVRIERLETVSLEQFEEIMKIIKKTD